MPSFCLGQKDHFPGCSADNFDILKSQEYKSWKTLPEYNIEMLYILTFQVLSMFFLLNFLFCPGFSQVLDKFQTVF